MRAHSPRPHGLPDWAEIRKRVEAAGETLRGGAVPPEQAREVLEERARRLARPVVERAAGGGMEVVTFSLAREVYAIESRYVIEVFRPTDVSPLPGAQASVFGVTGWRGELLTIRDLRQVLGRSGTVLDDLRQVLVLGDVRPAFGVLANAVHEVANLGPGAVRAPPEGVAVDRRYVKGVTADAVLVLEAEALLRIHAGGG